MSTILENRSARLLGAGSLICTAALSVLSIVFQPEFPAEATDRLAAIDEGGTSAMVSIVAFTLAQLPFMVAAVIVAALGAPAARRTAVVGGVLAILGGFGHAVFGGIGLSQLAMAASSSREAMGDVLEGIESGPAVVFMAMGLLGTVVGLLLLSIALFRSESVPRWIPVTLWVFLVVEFVGANLSEWASPTAGVLYLAACTGLALALRTLPAGMTGNTADDAVSASAMRRS